MASLPRKAVPIAAQLRDYQFGCAVCHNYRVLVTPISASSYPSLSGTWQVTARTNLARQPPSLQNSGTDLSLELQLAATGQIQAVPPESHPSNTKSDHRTQQVMARIHPARRFPWLLNSGTEQFRTAVCHNKPDPGHGTNVIVVVLCNFDSSTYIIS